MQPRSRNDSGWKQRQNRPASEQVNQEPGVTRRSQRLSMLLTHLDRIEAGDHLGLAPAKLQALEEGRLPIGQERAFFIEAELGLPGGWLDGTAEVDFNTFVPAYLMRDEVTYNVVEPVTPPKVEVRPQEATPVDAAPWPETPMPAAPAATTEQAARPVLSRSNSPLAGLRQAALAGKPLTVMATAVPTPQAAKPVTAPAPTRTAAPIVPAPIVEPAATALAEPAVTDNTSTDMDETTVNRVRNLKVLTTPRGFKSSLAKLSGLQDSYVSRLLATGTQGFRALSDKQARRIEQSVSLPTGWLDTNTEVNLPPATMALMDSLVSRREPGRKQFVMPTKPAAVQQPAPAQVMTPAAPTPASPVVRQPAVAKQAKPQPVPMPATPAPVQVQPVPASPEPVVAQPQLSAPAPQAAPVARAKGTLLANALLAMLAQRIEDNTLSDANVYALLGVLLEKDTSSTS